MRARRLRPEEQAAVRARLEPALAAWFFRQDPADQRHAYEVYRRLPAPHRDEPDVAEAALMHDIGKVHSGLGPVARSVATVLGGLRLPMPARLSDYREHGGLGADLLEGLEASPLAVAFARCHPGATPDGIDPGAWAALAEADHR